MAVELDGERLAGKLAAGDVGQHAAGIDIDGVAAWRLDDGDAMIGEVAAQIARGDDAVAEIIGIEDLFESNGDSIEIAPGEAAICGEALGEDEQVGFLLGEAIVIRA